MSILTIAAFEALPDVSTAYGRRRVAVDGKPADEGRLERRVRPGVTRA